ncbi:unnamed protein product [Paramecium octaurelia]|uniref:Uncharacterized protein n=1 Tax=Paramecium octaurelia TaxID=43137 RepID=A0A8S1UKG1_PAROT|nr:unnamed protein product [Paramecium octaurelia]
MLQKNLCRMDYKVLQLQVFEKVLNGKYQHEIIIIREDQFIPQIKDFFQFPYTSTSMTISIGTPIFATVSENTPYIGIRYFEVFSYYENKIIIDESLLHQDDYILEFEEIFSSQQNCVVGCRNCIRDLCVECFSG